MIAESIRIENYRSFKDETIPLDGYSCFVGPNGAGKSTVLAALNVFFQNSNPGAPNVKELEEEDFHKKDTSTPIRITVTFSDLSTAAKGALRDYVRLDKLIVTASASWDADSRAAPVKQYGQRLGMKKFADEYFSKASVAKVADLKIIFAKLRAEHSDIEDAKTGPAMAEALRKFEAEHSNDCELIPSGDEFYGSNEGKLKPFVQWVYVPAVKDAQEEGEESKKSALGQLLARTVRAKTNFTEKIKKLRDETTKQYQELLDENQAALGEVTEKLKTRLAEWAHTDTNLDVRWLQDQKSVQVADPIAGVLTGEGDFTGKLSRMGHGLQRSYLLALLTELASSDTEDAPTLLLGCEEPELYQHPPQARRLSEVFRSLAGKNTQVLVTTHSPFFVSGKDFESVRLIRREPSSRASSLSHTNSGDLNAYINTHSHYKERPTAAGLRAKITQSLQPSLNEMFFCSKPVFVEGLEDVAFITTALHLYGYWGDFHAKGCHLIAANGKNHLVHPVAVANKLNVPYFLVFDCDSGCRAEDAPKHELDNKTLFSLVGAPTGDAFPVGGFSSKNCRAWQINMGKTVEADFEKTKLCGYMQEARKRCGQAKSLTKNAMFISEWLTLAHEDGGSVSQALDTLCKAIIA